MRYFVQVLLLALFTGGCSLTTTVPAAAKYMLSADVEITGEKGSLYSDKVVRMGEMESPAILDARSIYYKTDEGRSYTYTKARWMESVPQQLSKLMMLSITKSKLFKDVIPFRSLAKNDLIFESSLYEISPTIHDDGTSTLLLSMKVRLVEQYSRKIIATHLFELKKEGVPGNAEGAVKGYSEMTKELLLAIDTWLKQSCKRSDSN